MSTVEVSMVDRNPNASAAAIDLIVTDSALLGGDGSVEFSVRPSVLVLSNDNSSIGYAVEIDLYSPTFSIIPKGLVPLLDHSRMAIANHKLRGRRFVNRQYRRG